MPGRLDQIEGMLKTNLGSALLAACPDLVYTHFISVFANAR